LASRASPYAGAANTVTMTSAAATQLLVLMTTLRVGG
jgi:hypothetical protein